MDDLVAFVAGELSTRADPEKAVPMAAYLKTDMPCYGVQKKGRTEVARAMRLRFPVTDNETYRAMVSALWGRPHREERYLAIHIARNREFVGSTNLDLYERMIVEGAWWDLVDDVAINCVGIAYLQERPVVEPVIEAWIDDDDMWLRRTALIAPIKHKHETDHERLFDHCLRRAHETEFFIRKAIGWTLREFAKTEPDLVREFIVAHQERWSGLTYREASKHLDV